METNSRIQLFPVLRIAIFFITGILIGNVAYLKTPIAVWFAALLATVFAILLTRNKAILNTILIFTACILLGIVLTMRQLTYTNLNLPKHEVRYKAVITSTPVKAGKIVRCDILIPDSIRPIKVKASIFADNRALRLRIGDGIEASSLLDEPTNFVGSKFDYRRYLINHGYSATTFIYITDWKGQMVNLKTLSYIDRARIRALVLRHKLLDKYSKIGLSGESYAVMAAMTLGDKSALSKELKDDYSTSGASHILALSGLHLGIIYTILSLIFIRQRYKSVGVFLIICTIWIYVFIVGLPVSAIRAAVMLTIYSLISLVNRDKMSLNALSVAAVAILACSPLDIFDVGFQMSFIAVLSIFLLYKPILNAIPKHIRNLPIIKQMWQMAAISISAQIGVAPLIAFYFGKFSCYFLLTNFIAIPAATIIIYSATLVLTLGFVPLFVKIASWTLLHTTSLLNKSVVWIASLPGSSIEGIKINALQTVLIYIIIGVIYMLAIYLKKIINIDKNPLESDC